MADHPPHAISPGQLVAFLISSQLGLGILELPRYAVEKPGHAGWLLVLATGLMSMAAVGIILALCGRFRASVLTINRKVLGRIPGDALNVLILILLFAVTIVNVAYFIQVMKIIFFKETPPLALAAILMIPMVYLTAKGLNVVGRFDTFVYIALLSLGGMMLAARRSADWTFLLPLTVFRTHAFLEVLPRLAYGFTGFDLLLIIHPWVRREPRAALAAAGLSTMVLTAFVAFTVSYYGETFIPKQVFPLLSLVRTIQAPVIERLDIYFTMIWLPAMSASATAYFAATQLALTELFPRLSYRPTLAILTLLVAAAGLYLRNFDLVGRLTGVVGAAEYFGFGLVLPSLLWLIAASRGVKD